MEPRPGQDTGMRAGKENIRYGFFCKVYGRRKERAQAC